MGYYGIKNVWSIFVNVFIRHMFYLQVLLWSGTVFTRLVTPAYTAVRDAFRRRVGLNLTVTSLGGFDTCYSVPISAPTITLMFPGMNVTLPQDNLLIHSTAGSMTCLAMAASPDNVNSVLNVIASMQQQNHRYLFDVPNSRLGVAREPCSSWVWFNMFCWEEFRGFWCLCGRRDWNYFVAFCNGLVCLGFSVLAQVSGFAWRWRW